MRFLLLLSIAVAPAVLAQDLPRHVVGNWACVSGACSDPEIQFAVEDGQRVYNSWLHARPSASGGRWALEGKKLVVECCAGLKEEWIVLRADARRLHLREAGGKAIAVYRRLPR